MPDPAAPSAVPPEGPEPAPNRLADRLRVDIVRIRHDHAKTRGRSTFADDLELAVAAVERVGQLEALVRLIGSLDPPFAWAESEEGGRWFYLGSAGEVVVRLEDVHPDLHAVLVETLKGEGPADG